MIPTQKTKEVRSLNHLIDASVLKQFYTRSDVPALTYTFCHFGLLAIGAVLIDWLIETGQSSPLLWLVLFLHGIVLVHLFAPMHETSHASAFKTPLLNKIVLHLTGFLLFIPGRYFTLEHHRHHAFTNQPEHDPEYIPNVESLKGYLLYATALPYFLGILKTFLHTLTGQLTENEQKFIKSKNKKRVILESWVMLTGYAILLGGSFYLENSLLLWVWIIPRIMSEPVMRLIRMSEHVDCHFTKDIRANTRTTYTLNWVSSLNWKMNYHAEHHAAPNIPFFRLKDLHGLIEGELQHLAKDGYYMTHQGIIQKRL